MISFKILCLREYVSKSQKDLKNEKTTQEKVFIKKKKNNSKQTKTDPIKTINAKSEGKCKNGDKRKGKNVT